MNMSAMKELSVIIPVYNAEKFLPRCLDSILRQAFESMEVILINDGSTDASLAVCGEYAKRDSRVSVLSQENRGAVAARNRGMDMARGAGLLFVDADDYVSPGYLSALYAEALGSGADIVFTRICRMRGGAVVEETEYAEKSYSGLATKLALLKETYYPGPYAKIYKRSFLEKNALRFLAEEGYHGFAEDMLFALYAAYAADTINYCPSAVYYYCMDNENSICSAPALQIRNNRDRLVVIGHMLAFALKKNLADDELLPVLQAVENHLRWGGRHTLDSFLRAPRFKSYPVSVQSHFQQFAAKWKGGEALGQRVKSGLKDALQRQPGLYGRLMAICALFRTRSNIFSRSGKAGGGT